MHTRKTICIAIFMSLCAGVIYIWTHTQHTQKTPFIFLGGLGTERELTADGPQEANLKNALDTLKNTPIIPILSINLGYAEHKYATSKGAKGLQDEDAYTNEVVRLASQAAAPLWLHVRTNLNHTIGTADSAPLTAEQILADTAAREAFLARFRGQLMNYVGENAPYRHACTVILFEDCSKPVNGRRVAHGFCPR
jgi:hypothetical protein